MLSFKPIIGIVGRSVKINEKNIIQVSEEYRLAVIKAGGLPIIIVPSDVSSYDDSISSNPDKLTENEKENILEVLNLCDGILMTGGTRWHEFDEVICNFAIEHDIPILGICLGMQILANMKNFCGTINSDQTIKNNTIINHYQENNNCVHVIKLNSSKLKDILKKDTILVNSRHNYHVTYKEFFRVCAYSEDNLIEALEILHCRFAIGVQWHPESMICYDHSMLKIFEALVKAASENKKIEKS